MHKIQMNKTDAENSLFLSSQLTISIDNHDK